MLLFSLHSMYGVCTWYTHAKHTILHSFLPASESIVPSPQAQTHTMSLSARSTGPTTSLLPRYTIFAPLLCVVALVRATLYQRHQTVRSSVCVSLCCFFRLTHCTIAIEMLLCRSCATPRSPHAPLNNKPLSSSLFSVCAEVGARRRWFWIYLLSATDSFLCTVYFAVECWVHALDVLEIERTLKEWEREREKVIDQRYLCYSSNEGEGLR